MSLDLVRTEIKTIIEAVSGIGKVHDYERYTHDWKHYEKFFTKDDKVNVWQIERVGFTRYVHGSQGATSGVERVVHEFILRGFYGLSDDLTSDKTFHNIVEGVAQAFRDKPDLNGKAEMILIAPTAPMTATMIKDFLGAVLCHIAEIRLLIQEKVTF